jgi:hypothetical protein
MQTVTMSQVAEDLQKDKSTISRWIKKRGIPVIPGRDPASGQPIHRIAYDDAEKLKAFLLGEPEPQQSESRDINQKILDTLNTLEKGIAQLREVIQEEK